MPQWLHDRAYHIMAKNPEMNKSQAFAIATQQSHAAGKTPKGYGTAEGKAEAKAKFDEPKKEYKKTSDPTGIGKSLEKAEDKGKVSIKQASIFSNMDGFTDELLKIASRPDKQTIELGYLIKQAAINTNLATLLKEAGLFSRVGIGLKGLFTRAPKAPKPTVSTFDLSQVGTKGAVRVQAPPSVDPTPIASAPAVGAETASPGWGRFKSWVKANPYPTAAGAAAGGYFLGSSGRR